MGYQPAVDSYEESIGPSWDARRQVLAWSAGAEVVMRVKGMGLKNKADTRDTYSYLDHYQHHTRWFTFRAPGMREGRDDITSLHLLKGQYRQESSSRTDVEHVISGTASGRLELSHLELDRASSKTLGAVFETNNGQIRCGDVEASNETMLAVGLGMATVALYTIPKYLHSIPDQHEIIQPLSEQTVASGGNTAYTVRAIRFLSNNRLLVGGGLSEAPIHIYEVTSAGLSKDPIRAVDHLYIEDEKTSVYALQALASSAGARYGAGEIFLSGASDGIVRLHDLRSPDSFVASFIDSTDHGTIYSLQTIGQNQFVAGGARHSMLKFFDLRAASARPLGRTNIDQADEHPTYRAPRKDSGWNLYLNPRNESQRGARWQQPLRETTSPIYSLSSPSPNSASLIVGVENSIVELDFISMMDKHPDPLFARGVVRSQRGDINVVKSWNPKDDVLNFGMYEHSMTGAVKLKTQARVGKYDGVNEGMDGRWRNGTGSA